MAGASSLLYKAQFVPLVGLGLYLAFIVGLLHPTFQMHNIYLHSVKFPWNPKFATPERYGLSPQKARNLHFESTGGIKIGAWHVLPDIFHRREVPAFDAPPLPDSKYDEALVEYPVVLYLHGNAANRAAPFRLASYTQLTSRLSANVLAIDYRGFGDSEGHPTEEGLVDDAEAAWNWLIERRRAQGIPEEKLYSSVMVAGQSLGTGVAAKLTKRLVDKGTPPEALWLIAPYISIAKLVTSYRLGGIIPIFGPLKLIPYQNRIIDSQLYSRFPTISVLPGIFSSSVDVRRPHVVISHATDDEVIPFSHGETLFDGLLRHQLGKDSSTTAEELTEEEEKAWQAERSKLITRRQVKGWARTDQFWINKENDGPSVTLIRADYGGHNGVGDGIVDIVGDVTGIRSLDGVKK